MQTSCTVVYHGILTLNTYSYLHHDGHQRYLLERHIEQM